MQMKKSVDFQCKKTKKQWRRGYTVILRRSTNKSIKHSHEIYLQS